MNTVNENYNQGKDLSRLASASEVNTSSLNPVTGQTGWTHTLVTNRNTRLHEIGDHTIITRNKLIAELIAEYLATAPKSRL